jgi:hypothetical protein
MLPVNFAHNSQYAFVVQPCIKLLQTFVLQIYLTVFMRLFYYYFEAPAFVMQMFLFLHAVGHLSLYLLFIC